MTEEESEKAFHRTAELLVHRGFASRCVYDATKRVVIVDWLPEGRLLQGLLRKFYGVPALSHRDITPTELSMPVFMILFMIPVQPEI